MHRWGHLRGEVKFLKVVYFECFPVRLQTILVVPEVHIRILLDHAPGIDLSLWWFWKQTRLLFNDLAQNVSTIQSGHWCADTLPLKVHIWKGHRISSPTTVPPIPRCAPIWGQNASKMKNTDNLVLSISTQIDDFVDYPSWNSRQEQCN